jgi:hypothetical protein
VAALGVDRFFDTGPFAGCFCFSGFLTSLKVPGCQLGFAEFTIDVGQLVIDGMLGFTLGDRELKTFGCFIISP